MTTYALEGPKWATPIVTWAFAPAGGMFSSGVTGDFQSLVLAAFARWDDLINIGFQQVSTPAVANILVGFSDFGSTSAQVGETDYGYLPTAGTFVSGVKIRIEDPTERPAPVVNGTPQYQGTQATVEQVLLHEIGHAIGLAHDDSPAALMYGQASSQNRDIAQSDMDGIHQIYAAPAFTQINTANNAITHPDGVAYSGPVNYLAREYIYNGTDPVVIGSSQANVFIKGGPGDDAIAVTSGQNVLDGGTGSNFLVGGTGNDQFYVDGRGGQVSWGTFVNFHAGDSATLFGFDPAIATRVWSPAAEGAVGYTGATIHASLYGQGINSSMTFANITQTQADHFVITTGTTSDGVKYMLIVNPG